MTQGPNFKTALLLGLSACLLQACSVPRLQTLDEFSGSVYSSEQFKARQDCQQYSSAAEQADCRKRAALSYEDYKKEREKLKK